MIDRTKYLVVLAFASLMAVGGLVGPQVANAIQMGAGSDLTAPSLDSAGARLNIDNTVFPNLDAATYDIESFEYLASTNVGDVQPFLAKLTGADKYEVLWVGPTGTSPAAGGIVSIPFTSGTQQFGLLAATDVYAGINVSSNTVYYGAGSTDHNGSAFFSVTSGDSIGPFSNNNLGRSYAFEINVSESGPPPPMPPLQNPGFESPDFGDTGYEYGSDMLPVELAAALWTFDGGAGLSGPNGPWKANDTSLDPLGDQFAYLQGPASVSQDLVSLVPGSTYALDFFESYRTVKDPSNDLAVILDEGLGTEQVIYLSNDVDNALWESRQTDEFLAVKDVYTLTFRTTNPLGDGDRSTLIDGVALNLISSAGVPEPSSIVLAAFGLLGLVWCGWRRRRLS